ncbi:hypothetical protein TOPH_05003 [Tolypocladium ophioglossoides CBS 100239]|uniref:Protein kinase domain-containing protein n=1 Tax=Tolypocladium ophioglossoides (strain CBS 100239) TaxID=1163406 RepID=A0A0L0N8W9_TOLOC|nr:hypothetical protein TOPH_05003 [Tolypocladium ophioglossoides CBS 100239]
MAQSRSIEELERLLRQAELRADEAERERQEERQRAEREQQRAEEAEEQTRATTLDEYIAACHGLVFSKFAVETDPRLTSKGPITNPRNKWCPTNLKPWSDFLDRQRVVFGTLYDTFPAQSRVFENRSFLAGLGNRVSKRSIADEKTLEHFLHNSVEDPVRAIVEQLKQVGDVCSAFDMGNGIIFENHPHAISDVSEEVSDRETPSPPQTPPQTSANPRDLNQLRPDQICVYRSNDALTRTMIYVSEYKPPHKLTAPHLRLGLRPMNILKDVVNRKTIPTSVDPDGRFRYFAERLTASAITQTYHYMIEGGLEYGLLTTGEAVVFLRVDWNEPGTLYYHLAEPGPEVSAHPNHFHVCTAVGQYLAFTLIALGSPGERWTPTQEERRVATLNLSRWAEDFETTLRTIPASERRAPDSSPAFEPTTYEDVDREPYLLRGKRRRRLIIGDEVEKEAPRRDGSESSDDESAPNPPDTPSPAERRSRAGGQATRRSQRIQAQRSREGGGQDREYCTQKCLLGLAGGGFLDPACPNVALHLRQDGCDRDGTRIRTNAYASIRHPVDHAKWLQLLWKQLERSLDDGITSLGVGGARGVLFRVTLLAYGYTFVSKGTVRAFIPDLEHEAAVYKRLRSIQGINVPVFLGAVDLRSMNEIYYYDHRVYVVHMTFLSWGGHDINPAETVDRHGRLLEDKAVQSLRAMHQEGVIHKDARVPNMLFNPETNGVMIVDFERSSLLEPPRRPLAQSVPNKRAGKQQAMGVKTAAGDSGNRSRSNPGFADDIWMVKAEFSGRKLY